MEKFKNTNTSLKILPAESMKDVISNFGLLEKELKTEIEKAKKAHSNVYAQCCEGNELVINKVNYWINKYIILTNCLNFLNQLFSYVYLVSLNNSNNDYIYNLLSICQEANKKKDDTIKMLENKIKELEKQNSILSL